MPTMYYTFSKGIVNAALDLSYIAPEDICMRCKYSSPFLSISVNLYLQTSITVKVNLDSDVHSYTLAWKQYPQPWQDAISIPIPTANTEITLDATDLLPATTYCIRIQSDSGEFGDELIVDTEAVNCTPQTKCCCVVQ